MTKYASEAELKLLRAYHAAVFPLPDAAWADFSRGWEVVRFRRSDFLTQPGQIENWYYFVLEGVQRAFYLKGTEEITLAFTYPPSLSGIPESFLTQKPSRMYLQALTSSRLMRISYQRLQDMYARHREIESLGRRLAEILLVGVAERQIEILSYSAEERYQTLMERSPHIFQLVPQKYLASYLGMTPETFSRMRKQLS